MILSYELKEISQKIGKPIHECKEILDLIAKQYFPIQKRILEYYTQRLSFGDQLIDEMLGGGLVPGQVTEIYGESGTGKSCFALQLCLQALLPIDFGGLEGGSLYIATSGRFSTTRLSQLYSAFSTKFHLNPTDIYDWLDGIHVCHVRDQETFTHLMRYQVPRFIKENEIRLLVIDSVTSNFRGLEEGGSRDHFLRSAFVFEICAILGRLAATEGLVVLLINEVSSNFKSDLSIAATSQGTIKQCDQNQDDNVPALGLSLESCVNACIKMSRNEKRRMELVFSPQAAPAVTEFHIYDQGIVSIDSNLQ